MADSQVERLDSNIESIWNLQKNLETLGFDFNKLPHTIQLNKKDLSNIISTKEFRKDMGIESESIFESVAHKGLGVFETFNDVAQQVYQALIIGADSNKNNLADSNKNNHKELESASSEELIKALEDKNLSVRLKAINYLCEMGEDIAISPLISLLKDTDETIRYFVIRKLAYFKKQQALDLLIKIFQNKEEPFYLRSQIIETLTILDQERVIDPLIDSLKDQSPQIRTKTVEALGRLKAIKAVEPIIDLLKDSDLYVRAESAEALGRIGNKQAIEPLISLIGDHEEVFEKTQKALSLLVGKQEAQDLIEQANPARRKLLAKVWWQFWR